MFGYIKPDVGELLVREHNFYRAVYCGVCRSMKAHTGALSHAALTYDSVFLALVRMCLLPDAEIGARRGRCIAHPVRKIPILRENAATVYTARVFALLSYYKLLDDLADERGAKRAAALAARPVLSSARKKADMPALDAYLQEKLGAISALEQAGSGDVDAGADLFGDILGEIFAGETEGESTLVLRTLGHYLGRFIYCADAAEDYEEDRRAGRYNPYVVLYGGDPIDRHRSSVRAALMMDCRGIESAVNLLPFGNRRTIEQIVRNIIYLGLTKRISFLDDPAPAAAPVPPADGADAPAVPKNKDLGEEK